MSKYRYIKLTTDWRDEEVLRARLTDEQLEQITNDVDGIYYQGRFFKTNGLSNGWHLYKEVNFISFDVLHPTEHHHAWLGEKEDYQAEQKQLIK